MAIVRGCFLLVLGGTGGAQPLGFDWTTTVYFVQKHRRHNQ